MPSLLWGEGGGTSVMQMHLENRKSAYVCLEEVRDRGDKTQKEGEKKRSQEEKEKGREQ